jgi:hypothetical protein
MRGRTIAMVAAGAVAGIAAWWFLGDDESAGVLGDVRQAFRDAINGITQGSRLTHCSYDKSTGVAPCDPAELARQAGLELETYALARMIASEEGNSSREVQALVGHAVNNAARASGTTIAAKLLRAKLPAHSGRFGTQRNIEEGTAGYNGSDRFASTATDPYEGHAAVAQGVLNGSIPDLTNGATQFDRTGGESDPDRVAQNRIDSGAELVPGLEDIEGIGDLRFWTRTSS